ncbi:hypothetical protein BH10CHL1_BH10CHL1_18040 [soil metagenome]
MDIKQRILLDGVRQCLIRLLGYLEDYLEVERSITPRRKREKRGSDND